MNLFILRTKTHKERQADFLEIFGRAKCATSILSSLRFEFQDLFLQVAGKGYVPRYNKKCPVPS